MARMIGGKVSRPQQQMQRAFGAPQARPAQPVGQRGVPHPDRAAPRGRAQATLMNRQRRAVGASQGMGGGIDVSRYFGEGSGLGGGGGGANGVESALKCNDCGVGLIAGFDAMENPEGLGVLCKGCWADMWIPHPHGNVAGLAGNTCTMGIRWSKEEWNAIQGIVSTAINGLGGRIGRYPTSADYPTLKQIIDPMLGGMQRSMKCKACKADVVFKPTADDVPMAGINAPAQQG